MLRKGISTIAALLVIILTPAGCRATPVPPYPQIRLVIGVSDSTGLVARDLADAYRQLHPNISIQMETGNSSTVLAGFSEGRFALVVVSRNPRAEELANAHGRAVEIGRDGIAVIVNAANSVTSLSIDELARIMSGDSIDWSQFHSQVAKNKPAPIQVVSRESGSGTRAVFERIVMPGRRVTPTAIVKPGEREVESYVAGDPNGIGYMAFSIWHETAQTHALSLNKVAPRLETIGNGSYPLITTLYLALPDPADPEVEAFASFVVSESGRELISKRVAVTH